MEKEFTCNNCGNQFVGKYCNNCGEKVYNENDKTIYHFFEDAIHFITHLDGTLINTLKAMFTSPGLLSVDYCNGKRRKYFKPLSLFLTLIILYLLFPLFQGLNMTLYNNLHNGIYEGFASKKVADVMQQKSLTFDQLSILYHEKSEKISKFLLIIIIPVTAFFFWLFFHGKRKYLFDHLVFSTEISSFYLLWGFLIFPLIVILLNFASYTLTKNFLLTDETTIGIILYLVFGIYTALATSRFYSLKKWQAILFTFLFIAFHVFFVLVVYKFILFAITIYLF